MQTQTKNKRYSEQGLGIDPSAQGVLPSQMLRDAIRMGWITAESTIPANNLQPASLDLRLGSVAYRLRCSFLPDNEPVKTKLERYCTGIIDLTGAGGILEQNRPYLTPLEEQLALPAHVRAKANPKSSTGRLDVFARVITDHSYLFDEIVSGYHGQLYVEIVPKSYAIRARRGLTLNQIRLKIGEERLSDHEIRELHQRTPLIFANHRPLATHEIKVRDGLFLDLHLPDEAYPEPTGYRAKENSPLIDMSKVHTYEPYEFWEGIHGEPHGRLILQPERFYLLLSKHRVVIPPEYAAEMIAYDPSSGELRPHYAGFFDPGFGYLPGRAHGSRAALEVRAHDVPFVVEDGQPICRLTFERMVAAPDRLYGTDSGSNYQGQETTLGKHFRRA